MLDYANTLVLDDEETAFAALSHFTGHYYNEHGGTFEPLLEEWKGDLLKVEGAVIVAEQEYLLRGVGYVLGLVSVARDFAVETMVVQQPHTTVEDLPWGDL